MLKALLHSKEKMNEDDFKERSEKGQQIMEAAIKEVNELGFSVATNAFLTPDGRIQSALQIIETPKPEDAPAIPA